jgi:hypothetical protein
LEAAVGTRINLCQFDDAITLKWQTHSSSLFALILTLARSFGF